MNGFIRKFGLESADGIRLALNGEQNIWLTDPAGLGISSAPKLADNHVFAQLYGYKPICGISGVFRYDLLDRAVVSLLSA